MTRTPLRRALALTLSLTLAAGMALLVAPVAQAAPLNDATLSSLVAHGGTFDAPFTSDNSVVSTSTVPNSTTMFSFTAIATDPGATIQTWNGSNPELFGATATTTPAFLRVGLNILTATVTAPDHTTTKQYTVHVTRQAAPAPTYNLDLNSLAVVGETLAPAFTAANTAYTVDVPYTTTSVEVAPGLSPGNTVVVTNASQQAGTVIRLNSGTTLALVTVTAPDQTFRQYTVHITRGPAPTADVDLAGLSLSIGTLSPTFDPAQPLYSATVPYANRSVQITAKASTSGHTMTINNQVITDNVPFTVPLGFNGGNGFGITITAANGVTKTYAVTITRDQPSTNAQLTGLSLSAGALAPAFSNGETEYAVTVPYLTTSTTVTGVVADSTAILRVNNRDTASGAASAPIALKVGANSITVSATAEDGVTATTRTIVVTRTAPDLNLNTLTVSGGTLSPAFAADTAAYTLALPYTTSSVDVAATAVNSDWALAIQGAATSGTAVAVPVGSSTISVTVTAVHGEKRTYTVAVTRAAASANAELGGITLSNGTLAPAFSAATSNYTASVDYSTDQITVGGSVADATSGLTVNGKSAASAVVPLVVGKNTITLVTTAQNGTTKTTTIVVTREVAPSPQVALTLGFVAGDQAANAPSGVTASNLLPGSTATLTMHSTPLVLASGIVKADGTVTLSARIPANAELGAHRLVFGGTAVDGSAVSQTAWFTVLKSGKIGAASVIAPVEYVEPKAATAPAASAPLANTGADAGFGTMAGTGIIAFGAALLLLGAVLRRRRNAA